MLDSTADYSWLPDISAAGQLVSNQKPKTNLLSWSTMFLLSQGMCMTKIYNPHLATDKLMFLCLKFQWKCLTMSFKLTKGTQGQTNFTFQNPGNKHLISLWHTAINVSSGVVTTSQNIHNRNQTLNTNHPINMKPFPVTQAITLLA